MRIYEESNPFQSFTGGGGFNPVQDAAFCFVNFSNIHSLYPHDNLKQSKIVHDI